MRSLAVLLIALGCVLSDFSAVVFTKENVAAKALSDQIVDFRPPGQQIFSRLLGRIEEGKDQPSQRKSTYPAVIIIDLWLRSGSSSLLVVLSRQNLGCDLWALPVAVQGKHSLDGCEPAVRWVSWSGRHDRTATAYPGSVRTGEDAFGGPNSIYLSNPKNGHQTNRTILWNHLAFFAESSGVTKLERFQLFPHSKWGFNRCTDPARLRQDSATKGIKTGTKLW